MKKAILILIISIILFSLINIVLAQAGCVTIKVEYNDGQPLGSNCPRSNADVRKSWPLPYVPLGTTGEDGMMQNCNHGLSEGDYQVQAWYGGSQFGPNTPMHVDGNGDGSATIRKNINYPDGTEDCGIVPECEGKRYCVGTPKYIQCSSWDTECDSKKCCQCDVGTELNPSENYDSTQDSDCPTCKECSSLDVCSNVQTGTDPKNDCTGNCDYCSSGNCVGDESICESTYKCSDCTGSGTSYNCTYNSLENQDCPLCQKCSALGTCGSQPDGMDIKNECPSVACDGNNCNGAGNCQDATGETGYQCTNDCYDCVSGTCTAMTENNDGTCSDDCNSCVSGNCNNRLLGDDTECSSSQYCNAAGGDCKGLEEDTNVCQFFSYHWTGNGGNLNCCGNNALEDSPFQVPETTCNDGNDNDCDGLKDCLDSDCAGKTGPGGQVCCQSTTDCGFCKKCSSNICIYQTTSEDLKNQCSADSCKYGYCNGVGACNMKPTTTDCGTCALCNGLGDCNVYDPTQNSDCNPFDIATCFNVPDSNDFTWDFRDSQCSALNTCSQQEITHTCNQPICGAACDGPEDCASGICQNDCTCALVNPPIITIISPTNNTSYYKTTVLLSFTIDKPTSWIGYTINNTANKTISGPINMTGLANGWNNVKVFANDTSGNMGASNRTYFFYCLADINGDKVVNILDAILLSINFGKGATIADLNNDGKTNILDAIILSNNFGKRC